MINSFEQLTQAFYNHCATQYPATETVQKNSSFSLTTDESKQVFGDITTNIALLLAKEVKKAPLSVAQEIAQTFQHPLIESFTVAPPGFINFQLTTQALYTLAQELYEHQQEFFVLNTAIPRKEYSIEFVSANPTGPLHVGHGRGGIIGDVLGNILRFIGHPTVKEFYINDAGAQINKLGASLKLRCEQALGHEVSLPEGYYQGEYLIELARELLASHGPTLLTKPDSFFEEYAKNTLLEHIRKTLTKYGITFDVWFSEKSLYENNAVQDSIEFLTARGYTYHKDDALWLASTQFGDDKDRVLRKSNGEYTYIASDVAYVRNKLERGAQQLIMILGQDHHGYILRMKAIMQALGYSPDQLDIILYQLVTLKESGQLVKLSKRAGRIISLQDVIETVSSDIARFFYLHRKADAHLEFDIDLALKQTDENPVYYLQYAYVRTGSILSKASEHPELRNITNADFTGLTTHESLLLKKLISLKELLITISKNYQTHLLSYYVLELAHLFHHYYSKNRVIDLQNVNTSRARLALIQLVRNVLSLCFSLLEISKPESM